MRLRYAYLCQWWIEVEFDPLLLFFVFRLVTALTMSDKEDGIDWYYFWLWSVIRNWLLFFLEELKHFLYVNQAFAFTIYFLVPCRVLSRTDNQMQMQVELTVEVWLVETQSSLFILNFSFMVFCKESKTHCLHVFK